MKVGDKIRVVFVRESDDQHAICTVKSVLPDGLLKATIDNQDHPLHAHNGKPRELFVAPGNYEEL